MKKVKLGILGVSRFAFNTFIYSLKKAKNVEIIAIASRDLKKAMETASKFNIKYYYGNYEELLKNKEVDAVYIPLPNHLHYKWAKNSILAGKHCLIEKPITTNLKELISLYKSAENNKRKVMEALLIPFNNRLQKVKDLVSKSEIGVIKYIFSDFSILLKDYQNIRYMDKPGAGSLNDLGIYNISLSNFILDSFPIEGFASLIKKSKTRYVDIGYEAILVYPGGMKAIFTGGFDRTYNMEIKIVGDKGKIFLKDFLSKERKEKIFVQKENKKKELIIKVKDHYKSEIENFVDSILSNNELKYSSRDTLINRFILDKLIESNKKRKVMDLKFNFL